MKGTKRTVQLHEITRLNNSVNGNPRFAITWEREVDGKLVTRQTGSDASINYAIGNEGLRAGDTVEITLTKAERIIDMVPALTGDCSIDCVKQCAYPGRFSECEVPA